MSTHKICFHREIRKILCGYPLLSVAMVFTISIQTNSKNASFFSHTSRDSKMDLFTF